MMDYWRGFEYKLNGKLHRTNGPAIRSTVINDFHGRWWLFGKRHRYYGPTRASGGTPCWWIHGKRIE